MLHALPTVLKPDRAESTVEGAAGSGSFPIAYVTHEGCIYFRSTRGFALTHLDPQSCMILSFDVESESIRGSVIVHGRASRLASDQDVARSGIQQARGWHADDHVENADYFELRPDRITGRGRRGATRVAS